MTEVYGRREAHLRAYRVETLRREGFTEGEIVIYLDRRISTRGIRRIRRERARELAGLTEAERREWAEQNEEAYNEETAIAALRRVSPEE
jgi:hypothetical protein